MIKMSGKDFKRFMDDEKYWPADAEDMCAAILIDDDNYYDNYTETAEIPDNAKVKISGGIVMYNDYESDIPFEKFIRRWIKLQETTTIIVEVKNKDVPKVIKAIRAAGGKV